MTATISFLLKKRTGLNISDNCLARLSHEVAGRKIRANESKDNACIGPAECSRISLKAKTARAVEFKKKVAEIAESLSVDKVLAQQPEPQPVQKKKRGRPRKTQQVTAQ